MDVVVKIDDQLIIDLIITALEGGSNYWYFIKDTKGLNASQIARSLVTDPNFNLKIYDIEDEEYLGTINKYYITKSLNQNVEHLESIIEETYDSIDADVIFQYAVMGELRFG